MVLIHKAEFSDDRCMEKQTSQKYCTADNNGITKPRCHFLVASSNTCSTSTAIPFILLYKVLKCVFSSALGMNYALFYLKQKEEHENKVREILSYVDSCASQ